MAAHMNGPVNGDPDAGKYIDSIDPDDPAYQREMQRPAIIKEDVTQMERRRRVSLILNSKQFREEIEHIVTDQLSKGPHPNSILALKSITELMLPQSHYNQTASMQKGLTSGGTVIPVNDIKGQDSKAYNKGERLLRCKLAAAYRLVDLYGWTHGIYNHITARVSMDAEHFLINPFGMMYHEVTAASLVKVDMQGEIVDPGVTNLGINTAGYTLHSAIHMARPDIRCIIHLHTPAAVAVSAMKQGLMPVSTEACVLGGCSYHDYSGIIAGPEERDAIARSLGVSNKVMFLRNHGVVCCGATIEEAWHYTFNVMAACETQIRLVPVGAENYMTMPDELQQRTHEVATQGSDGDDPSKKKWRTGELEFEALMRHLDNAGFRTGYIYKDPITKNMKNRTGSEVEIPPSATSLGDIVYDDDQSARFKSPIKEALNRQRQQGKSVWLNSPNVYNKEEVSAESGTVTKWKAEGSPNKTSTPIKSDLPSAYGPAGGDPKELKHRTQEIRKVFYGEKIQAGPQSRILDGVAYDEAQRLNKEGEHITVSAASKGIIQRDHQQSAVVYKQYLASNPFSSETQQDVDDYQREIERKARAEKQDALRKAQEAQRQSELQARGEPESPGVDARVAVDEPQQPPTQQPPMEQPHTQQPVQDEPKPPPLQRSLSDSKKLPEQKALVKELNDNFKRSKSERPKKTKAAASEEEGNQSDTLPGRSSTEASPSKSATMPVNSSTPKEKKKKKKFRMPSFSKKKDKKETDV